MKRIFSLICVFLLIFAAVSCGGDKKEKPAYEEQVTKEVSAEDGGKVESSDGKTSIEIPGGALDADTKITMTIYDAQGHKVWCKKACRNGRRLHIGLKAGSYLVVIQNKCVSLQSKLIQL